MMIWGWRDLNPHDFISQRIFTFPQLSLQLGTLVLKIGPSLYPRLYVRVAPVGPLHLPKLSFGLAQDCHSDLSFGSIALGFPEFESFHLSGFSDKAQFSKSAASTIPPHPPTAQQGRSPLLTCEMSDLFFRPLSIPSLFLGLCNCFDASSLIKFNQCNQSLGERSQQSHLPKGCH